MHSPALGAFDDGELAEIEFQSTNEKSLPIRMGEYLFATGRIHGRMPRQIVLYVGQDPMLASRNLGDNVIALLTRLGNQPETMRRILERIAEGSAENREQAMAELSILAGLRKREGEFREEAKKMPILNDIMDHEIIGPAIRQGRAEGWIEILLSQMEKRFGSVSPQVRERLATLKPEELKAASLRLLDAERIDDLFTN
jgi:hypothetical protein